MSDSIPHKVVKIMKNEGITTLFRKSIHYGYRFVRPHLPAKGYRIANSVYVEERKLGDRLFSYKRDTPDTEAGIVSAHNELTESGDRVVLIGGGQGISAVHASQRTGETGKVTVFEGGDKSIKQIKKVTEINETPSPIDIHHGIVGDPKEVYGGDTTAAQLYSPEDIPDCDVLELDCEGSEISILESIRIRPRVIIIELHPWLYPEDPSKPIEILTNESVAF